MSDKGKYVIYADSGADISPVKLDEWGVKSCPLTFTFEGEEKSYAGEEMKSRDFYARMRDGKIAHTAALNYSTASEIFRSELESGNDVFYLAFSSGLSSTFATSCTVAEDLMSEFPDRRVVVVDSLAASSGHGLLLWLCAKKKADGADIDELKAYAEGIRLNICHWFTVDDLVYLRRGGRVSAATALAGTVLGIKPVLHVDDEGHLINMMKVRGRKASIKAIADKFGELRNPAYDDAVFISHGDCFEDARLLAQTVKERFGVKVALINDIGPVIGAHSGPGTLALFFVGEHR